MLRLWYTSNLLVTHFPMKIEKYFKRAVEGTDGLGAIVTDHSEFRNMDFCPRPRSS